MEICPECGGDGYLVYTGAPGCFSEAFGNWLPSERIAECPVCLGTGGVDHDETFEEEAA